MTRFKHLPRTKPNTPQFELDMRCLIARARTLAHINGDGVVSIWFDDETQLWHVKLHNQSETGTSLHDACLAVMTATLRYAKEVEGGI